MMYILCSPFMLWQVSYGANVGSNNHNEASDKFGDVQVWCNVAANSPRYFFILMSCIVHVRDQLGLSFIFAAAKTDVHASSSSS